LEVSLTLFDEREVVDGPTPTQIKWAMNAWSRVCQRKISETRVRDYIEKNGWAKLEEELRYWIRMSRAPSPHKITASLHVEQDDNKSQESEDCEICGANFKAGNPKHDPDCPNNPIYDVCEGTMTLEEFESL
jgi:hypothetical protein